MFTVHTQLKQFSKNCDSVREATYNEIHLLRSVKHQGLMELKGVYEDNNYHYKVFELFKGESVYSL